MTAMTYHSEAAKELATIWQTGVADYIRAHGEVSRVLQRANQRWLCRVQSMAELGSTFGSKLMAARSPLDILDAWQEWTTRWLKMTAENCQQLLSDGRKLGELERRWVPTDDVLEGPETKQP